MHKPIRWGILGAGRVARDFAQGLRSLPDAELAAVASRTAETAREFNRQFPVKRVYSTYEELVADPTIDVVYVATPHHRHIVDSVLCLEHRKPVLCEKPFTVNARQARTVIELARKQQVFCMEAMWMRYFPLIRRVRELVHSGAIGDLRMINADFGVATAYSPSNRFYDPAQAGGALLDRGVYAVSLATMLLGVPNQVESLAGRAPTGVDEQSAVIFRYPKGQLAVLSASLSGYTSNEALIVGTHGRIRIHEPFYCPQRLSLLRYTPGDVASNKAPGLKQRVVTAAKQNKLIRTAYNVVKPLVRGRKGQIVQRIEGNGYNYEAAEVMRCLQAGELESPLMPLDETLQIMELMDKVREQWGLKYPGE